MQLVICHYTNFVANVYKKETTPIQSLFFFNEVSQLCANPYNVERLKVSGVIGERDESLDKILSDNGIGGNFTADMLRAYLAENTEGAIEIEISTVGGDVREGFEIYDLLQAEKAKGRIVKTYGKQFDSIGSVIFLAGSDGHRYAYRGASPLIHNSWSDGSDLSGVPINSENLRELAEVYDEADWNILSVYVQKSGRENKRVLQDLMRNETELTDAQLLELGFADKIIDEAVTVRGAKIRALAFVPTKAEAPNVYADCIILNEGKVFLIQRSLNDDFEPGTFAFPGGKVEGGELPVAGAARELFEETGLRTEFIEEVSIEQNEDGSTSHYFIVGVSGEMQLEEDEIASAEWFPIDALPENIIKGQKDRYDSLIQKSIQMSEKLTALEKATQKLEALAAKFGLAKPKAMYLPLKGGETQIFVDSEDGEFEGKKAFTVENGERTDNPAPAGVHELEDGRSITIGPDGVVESVQIAAMQEEEMQAMKEEVVQAMAAVKTASETIAAKDAQIAKLEGAQTETKAQILAMQKEVEELKKVVPGDGNENEAKERLLALKKQREEFAKLKPSERRLANLKLESK